MPEIAEVARIVHYLKKHIVGKTIASVKVQEDDIIYGKVGTSAGAFQTAMTGKKVVDARQQGKYFWLVMDSPPHPLMHFGMSGWMKFNNDDTAYYRPAKKEEEQWPPKFWKFILQTSDNPSCEAAFVDARRLGRVRLIEAKADDMRKTTPLKENGPDPVIDRDIVTDEWLGKLMKKKKVPIKALLLNQANISGVGNWVGDEVLYQARIHPEQYSNTFSDAQIKQLHDALISVCTTACELLGESERFPADWLMKHRWGKGKKDGGKLPNGEKITFITVGGRTSAVVPSRQKKTGGVAGDVPSKEEDVEEAVDQESDEPKLAKKRKTGKSFTNQEASSPKNKKKKLKEESEEEPAEEKPSKNRKSATEVKPSNGTASKGSTSKSDAPTNTTADSSIGRRRSARLGRYRFMSDSELVAMPQALSSKENSLFRQVVKSYETKQYKKGIKAADQVLRKSPNHGDTQAMKALIMNSQGHSDEAFALAKVALRNDMKSQICWHVYGILYRSQKNYDEAMRAYRTALRLDGDSQQIQRDLAMLQIQTRDYEGYIESRLTMLKAKPNTRQNWTALAVAHHLAGDLTKAEDVLVRYENSLNNPPPRTDLEHTEAALYKNTIIAEAGDYQRALDHIETLLKHPLDRTAVMEMRAQYLLKLGKNEDAEKAYRALIERNNAFRDYYDGLENALGLDRLKEESINRLAELYESLAKKDERVDAPRRIPLDFLQGCSFRSAADSYLKPRLNKGIPSLFANVKALYKDTSKLQTIEELVNSYLEKSAMNGSAEGETKAGKSDKFEESVLYFLAQHYNYFLSRDLEKATSFIDRALEKNPKSVDFNMTKARIFKNYGDTEKAAAAMNHARELDEKDRYINTKCAKYQLRNNQNDAALETMSKFTRNETTGGALGDLKEMQCLWYFIEDGEAFVRNEKYNLALKRFQTIYDIFDIWQEDQFDFHNFSLKKGQIRAYVNLIRWEDYLRGHPFFSRAAVSAIKIYILLHDRPHLASLVNGGADFENLDENEKKKALKKAKKEQEKQEKAEAEKQATNKKTTADGEVKKEDLDPKGLKLLQTKEPLEDATKWVNFVLQFSPKMIEAQNVGFEVYIRKGKYLLATRCLLAASKLDPENPSLHEQTIRLQHTLNTLSEPLAPKVSEVLKETFKLVPADTSLPSFNDSFYERHSQSAPHVRAALKVRQLLTADQSRPQNEKELLNTLSFPTVALADAKEGLALLSEWKSSREAKDAYLEAARKIWPQATVFKKS
ncbi:TPR-like protein [Patellaria atrata CBS 101060]|uniref:DNA-(apurinic or apyrimidinic site) lyase n=1 Tax=Patellaria atrata CBS 101060 TaxID=1346257 RepID=A0A9P4SH23_9PEZI|nr:TPR-like protein [Patellaria atrata CBS 101060]